MPKIGYKQTAEHIKKLSEAHNGIKRLPFSEETKRKISWRRIERKNKLGYINSPETREKMRKREISKETRDKFRMLFKGKHHSPNTEFKKGVSAWNKGKKCSEEWKNRNIENLKKYIIPKQDTKIEIKIQNFLKQLDIEFFTHQYIKEIEHSYRCDILVPSILLIIECDGDYWHKYPLGRDIDCIRVRELLEKGFKVLRLWECEIKKMDLKNFQKLIENSGGEGLVDKEGGIVSNTERGILMELLNKYIEPKERR